MDTKVDNYVRELASPNKEICEKLRAVIVKTFPSIKEELKWGVPAYDGGKYYFVALKNHVNLGFSIKGLSKEELSLFEGTGKTMRHLKIKSIDDIDDNKISGLLKMVRNKQA